MLDQTLGFIYLIKSKHTNKKHAHIRERKIRLFLIKIIRINTISTT
jgi:hypothetical protein